MYVSMLQQDDSRKRLVCWGAAALLTLSIPALSPAQTVQTYSIATIAGTGTAGFSGDGGQATSAQFSSPCNAIVDSSGTIYVSDSANNRVRKITSDGTVSTIAGNGTAGYAGDGKSPTDKDTELNAPCGLALDSSNNLYIADTGNHVIRKISGGNINTVAGNNQEGFSGDLASATSAQLTFPAGVTVDSKGQIYIADSGNNRVRLVGTDGNINTIVGDGNATRAGDGGLANVASVNNPMSIVLDEASGTYYIADTDNGVIRKVTPDGIINTIAGTAVNGFNGDGPALETELFYPKSIVRDSSGNIYFADSINSRIRVLTTSGNIATIAGNGAFGSAGDNGPARAAALNFPSSVALDSSGRIVFVDADNQKLRRLTPDPTAVTQSPTISAGGVISASAFGGFTYASPGTWIEIYGTNLALTKRTWANSDFSGIRAPLSLDKVKVTIGGELAYISYISPGQVNALIPSNVPEGVQTLTVTTPNGTSDPYNITIKATAPGLLAPSSFKIGAVQYVGAFFSDGTAVAPVGSIPGITSRPAKAGETVVIYGVGFGEVTPYSPYGEVAQAAASMVSQPEVIIGGTSASVYYAGVTPQSVGLYQINVTVPAVASGNAVPIAVSQGTLGISQTLNIAVQ
jgi:uncharacterized protein (TIGR03437 family)